MHGCNHSPRHVPVFDIDKNITFNQLINFMNDKYNLNIPESQLDSSDLNSNSWFTGFCEADANFSV